MSRALDRSRGTELGLWGNLSALADALRANVNAGGISWAPPPAGRPSLKVGPKGGVAPTGKAMFARQGP